MMDGPARLAAIRLRHHDGGHTPGVCIDGRIARHEARQAEGQELPLGPLVKDKALAIPFAVGAQMRGGEFHLVVNFGDVFGGDAEERAADYIKANVRKPVVGYVAGFTAPEGKTMGHAGAIVSGSSGTAAAKQEALEAVGVKVGKTPSATALLMREIMTKG